MPGWGPAERTRMDAKAPLAGPYRWPAGAPSSLPTSAMWSWSPAVRGRGVGRGPARGAPGLKALALPQTPDNAGPLATSAAASQVSRPPRAVRPHAAWLLLHTSNTHPHPHPPTSILASPCSHRPQLPHQGQRQLWQQRHHQQHRGGAGHGQGRRRQRGAGGTHWPLPRMPHPAWHLQRQQFICTELRAPYSCKQLGGRSWGARLPGVHVTCAQRPPALGPLVNLLGALPRAACRRWRSCSGRPSGVLTQ